MTNDRENGAEDMAARPYSITVIMPAYNAVAFLPHSLPPLCQLLTAGKVLEVIVIDDSSSDATARMASEMGARVIPSGGRLGPGGARNIAAKQASGDILWFVDSDVVGRPDGPEKIARAFTDPGVWAVFGSYDDKPRAQNFGSQYKNLVHHFVHQQGKPDASTFWAGYGAIRKDRFLAVGGFDGERYTMPSIEDIELGYRLRDNGGRILLDRTLLCTHLKLWTVRELIRVDILRRALPWGRLMLSRGGLDNDLNVGWTERLRAGLAGLVVLSVLAALVGVAPFWTPLAAFALAVAVNAKLFAAFARHKGVLFALAAIAFHQAYYIYSTAAFLWCWTERKLARPARAG
ncbi:MAG: glycosyltransferase [Alphaproteobacteria bacterium]|nr:glycosyltransferase [Alphaproteobacteria bacterium]